MVESVHITLNFKQYKINNIGLTNTSSGPSLGGESPRLLIYKIKIKF